MGLEGQVSAGQSHRPGPARRHREEIRRHVRLPEEVVQSLRHGQALRVLKGVYAVLWRTKMRSADTYLTVASMLSGFGITALVFRVGRELQVKDQMIVGSWISWADYLVLGAI